MVRTTDGFEIADVDLQLRGPGDLSGTQQSGIIDLLLADLAKDGEILRVARETVQAILEEDPELDLEKYSMIREQVASISANQSNWSRIS
jgi:ATP-dependent DNA helicase RecG